MYPECDVRLGKHKLHKLYELVYCSCHNILDYYNSGDKTTDVQQMSSFKSNFYMLVLLIHSDAQFPIPDLHSSRFVVTLRTK